MKTISTSEARKRFAEITDEVRLKGHSYSIVRHGKEVAQLIPAKDGPGLKIDPKLKDQLADFFNRYDETLRELAKR